MYDAPPQIKEEHLFVPKVFTEIDLKQRPYLINLQPRQKFLQKLTLNNQVELKQRPYLIKNAATETFITLVGISWEGNCLKS